jgi:hypothetical protein
VYGAGLYRKHVPWTKVRKGELFPIITFNIMPLQLTNNCHFSPWKRNASTRGNNRNFFSTILDSFSYFVGKIEAIVLVEVTNTDYQSFLIHNLLHRGTSEENK